MNDNFYDMISHNLRLLRKEFGLTQERAALLLHVCRTTYAMYENGTKLPGIDTIFNIAEMYRIPVSFLLEMDFEDFAGILKNTSISQRNQNELMKTFVKLSPFSQGRLVATAKSMLPPPDNKKQNLE